MAVSRATSASGETQNPAPDSGVGSEGAAPSEGGTALRDRLTKALRGKHDSTDARPSYRAADAVLPVVEAAVAEARHDAMDARQTAEYWRLRAEHAEARLAGVNQPVEVCEDTHPETGRRCTMPRGHDAHRAGGGAWTYLADETPPVETECPAWAWHACACPQQCAPESDGGGIPENAAPPGAATALTDLIRVAAYMSRGRRFVDVEPYPDALARKALGALDDATLHAALDQPEETAHVRVEPASEDAVRLASAATGGVQAQEVHIDLDQPETT